MAKQYRWIVVGALAMALTVWAQTNQATPSAETAVSTGAVVSQSADAESAMHEEKSALKAWCETVAQGGRTMIFLALLSVLGVACGLERFCHLRRGRFVPEGLTAEALKLWEKGEFDTLQKRCQADRSVLAKVIETLVEQRDNRDVSQVKMFAEDKAGRELRLENRRSGMLGIVATLSPLLGLFGTVVGLLGAFGTVAAMGDMGDPAAMAGDIGKALVTTVAGLVIAMPALFLYHHFNSRVALYGVMLEEELAALLNACFVRRG